MLIGIIRRNIPKPPSQTWKNFIKNHMPDIVAVDFLVVPTIRIKMLFVSCSISEFKLQPGVDINLCNAGIDACQKLVT
jgi:hypothetical protein